MVNIDKDSSPRVKIIQKLYSKTLNPDEEIIYNKSQYKKFIKDVTEGTIERKELIEETIEKFLKNDIDLKRTDKLLKIIIYAAVFELLYKHNNPKKVIISEYLKTSHFFLEKAQIKYLNAILDKLSDLIRKKFSLRFRIYFGIYRKII
jgi:N utilization substance protein B